MGYNPRILIVDDFPLIITIIQASLNELGYNQVLEAYDGSHAIEVLKEAHTNQRPIDVMFVDWAMPHVNGLELIEYCKSKPEFASLSIVVVSAQREPKKIKQALEAGAMDYITKPIAPSELTTRINGILAKLNSAKKRLTA